VECVAPGLNMCMACYFDCVYSAVNQRNRMRTIDEAVEACRRELEQSKNAKADPFTRRQSRPTLVTTVSCGCCAVC
jgi:hypothetical protein